VSEVGVVVIGRNEGERLHRCLGSVVGKAAHVVYVDSGSSDGSTKFAREMGVEVIDLDLSRPFTAARARNEGFARLIQQFPGTTFVQFVDGDCEVHDGWIAQAIGHFALHEGAAAVCGRRRERFPEASRYNHLCDLEWDTPVGIVKACGGDAMMRCDAFRQVGGFNNSLIAGEEPELCVRLRQAGWSIHRIDAEMTWHDAAMTRFSQWWKRNVRAGHAYAEGNALHGAPPEGFREREVRSNDRWGATVPVIFLILAIPTLGASILLLPIVYGLMALRVAKHLRRTRGWSRYERLLYGIFVTIGKFPQAAGQRAYRRARAAGKPTKIIEYKTAAVVAKV